MTVLAATGAVIAVLWAIGYFAWFWSAGRPAPRRPRAGTPGHVTPTRDSPLPLDAGDAARVRAPAVGDPVLRGLPDDPLRRPTGARCTTAWWAPSWCIARPRAGHLDQMRSCCGSGRSFAAMDVVSAPALHPYRVDDVNVRVVIAEDSLIVREGIRQILALEANVEVVAMCGDLPELMEAIERERPDVVLTDIRMPPDQADEGIRVAGWLREAHPEIGVVVLSQYAEPSYALTLLEPGPTAAATCSRSGCTTARSCVPRSRPSPQGGAIIDPKLVDVARRRQGAARALAAGRADAARARGARRDRAGQEQRGDRRLAGADQARRREAHQLDLPQARAGLRGRRERRVKATLLFLSETQAPSAPVD